MTSSSTKRRLATALLVSAAIGFGAWATTRSLVGEPSGALNDDWHRGHRIVDRHGALLRELPTDAGSRGVPMAMEDMGDRLVIATLVSEDRRFYSHSGVDVRAIMRAMGQNARHVRLVSGASTITQQLVKLLDTEGAPTRVGRGVGTKLREAARAQNLEEQLTKPEILEAYLNRLNYGRGLVGPKAAANAYFGVSPRDLSWAQAALLAVLPRAPSYLDPKIHPERAIKRQRSLVDALHTKGWMPAADHRRALHETIAVRALHRPFEAPHLTEALRQGVLGGLTEGGLTETSIDLTVQQDVEGLVDGHRARFSDKGASGAAVLVVDNERGEVLAYVGSGGWDDAEGGQIDMVRARRQPGSTLKPFVYAMAFESGLQPSEMLADVSTRFGEQSGAYAPGNFDGAFVGPISAREALAGSLNVPAVRLAATMPQGALLSRLHALGFASLDRSAGHYGLSLALGSGEVSLFELARAYTSLARGGELIELRVFIGDDDVAGARIIPAAVAAAISDTLSDPLARVRGLGGSGPFDIGMPVAVKTGTSSGYRDTYAVGYTRERTVAVWVGNPDGRATDGLTGGSGAGPLFADSMRLAMKGITYRRPLWDEGLLRAVDVCPLSGKPATSACPESVSRRMIAKDGHDHGHCDLHRHAKQANTAQPGFRCASDGDQSIVLLPDTFAGWLASQPAGAPGRDPLGLPWLAAGTVPGCDASTRASELRVEDPAPGSVLRASRGSSVELVASILGAHAPVEVEFVLDGEVVARSGAPYHANVPAVVGDHVLHVRPADPTASIRLAESRFSVR
jgi:penicillin-binding protein 1C